MVIRFVAVEIELVIYKVIDAVIVFKLENSAVLLSPRNVNVYVVNITHFVLELLRYALIKRQNNPCINILFTQCLRK